MHKITSSSVVRQFFFILGGVLLQNPTENYICTIVAPTAFPYKIFIEKENNKLTGKSFIIHVKLAAGFELNDVQLPCIVSPCRYLGCIPVITGSCFGNSV